MRLPNIFPPIEGFFGKDNIKKEPSGPEDEPIDAQNRYSGEHFWNYTDQYAEITGEGSLKPPPRLGSPSFIWHLAIWQRYTINTNPVVRKADPTKGIQDEFERSNAHDLAFFKEISTFLETLQEKGRVRGIKTESLRFEKPKSLPNADESVYRFGRCQPQSLSFTLWWQDNTGGRTNQNKQQDAPTKNDLRVRVQAQTFQDHATITFYIDAAKPYNKRQLFLAEEVTGVRRLKILTYLQAIRDVAAKQIKSGAIEYNFIPERNVESDQAEQLKDGAEYFFEGIWKEFRQSFGIERAKGNGFAFLQGETFADFRGVMMYAPGIETEASEKRHKLHDSLRTRIGITGNKPPAAGASASIGIGTFETFDNTSGEPNTVVRAYWPFIRRMTPWADYRDFSASGMINWRALFITSLGASGKFYGFEESASRDNEVPAGHRHKGEVDGDEVKQAAPIRWLVLTKGEPHRAQIGRFLERITAVGTMRLFSLRNLATIKNAATHIRVISRELDGILSEWTAQTDQIDSDFHKQVEEIRQSKKKNGRTSLFRGKSLGELALQLGDDVVEVEHPKYLKAMDVKIHGLTGLIYKTELKLIKLGARLDEIGQKGSGRLLYLISRAEYHMHEFERMRETLEIGNIDGWINYSQFVSRGLHPTFSLISRTGERLLALRARLQVVTETIQTSALIVETEATRANTQTLKNIFATLYWLKISFFYLVGASIIVGMVTFWSKIEKFLEWIGLFNG